MANFLINTPYDFFTDKTGRPLASGYLYIGMPGQDPQQFPRPVFFDEAGLIAAPNPVRTNVAGYPADSSGNPQRIYVGGTYSIRVTDSNQSQVFQALDAADGFYGVVASDLANNTDPTKGSDLVGYILASGNTGTTVHDKFERTLVDIKDFGAVGNGTTNDKAAFDAAAATGRSILLPAGNYNVPTGTYSNVRFYSWDAATCTNSTVAIVDPLANSMAVGTEATFPCIPSALPFGWIHQDGSTLSRVVYPQLWSFADSSGNIVDEVNKTANPGAFGRGNGTSTFSVPDKRGSNQGFSDAGRSLDASFVLGKLVTVTAASAAPGISVRSTISTPAIRAFAGAVNQGSIDIQALQSEVTALNGKILTRGTAQNTTSGTSIDLVGIPAGVKRFSVAVVGVSASGSSAPMLQLGAGSPVTSGYLGCVGASAGVNNTATAQLTTGVLMDNTGAAANLLYGSVIFTNISGNTWTFSGVFGLSNSARVMHVGGSIALAGVLDRVRLTTVNGTDTFDAGSINILWEVGQ